MQHSILFQTETVTLLDHIYLKVETATEIYLNHSSKLLIKFSLDMVRDSCEHNFRTASSTLWK